MCPYVIVIINAINWKTTWHTLKEMILNRLWLQASFSVSYNGMQKTLSYLVVNTVSIYTVRGFNCDCTAYWFEVDQFQGQQSSLYLCSRDALDWTHSIRVVLYHPLTYRLIKQRIYTHTNHKQNMLPPMAYTFVAFWTVFSPKMHARNEGL